ncbi:hypothetical protein Fmac_027240 [Flemingia macrophylla]|uniref:Uncharacterized protein n=1 Tax=Flemingia macrophylla TaxID=520843 RepID=A0ABD1LHA7_9FABA
MMDGGASHNGKATVRARRLTTKNDDGAFIRYYATINGETRARTPGRLCRSRSSIVGPAPLQPIPAPGRSGTPASGNAPGEPTPVRSVTRATTDAPGSQPSTTLTKPPAPATLPCLRCRLAYDAPAPEFRATEAMTDFPSPSHIETLHSSSSYSTPPPPPPPFYLTLSFPFSRHVLHPCRCRPTTPKSGDVPLCHGVLHVAESP